MRASKTIFASIIALSIFGYSAFAQQQSRIDIKPISDVNAMKPSSGQQITDVYFAYSGFSASVFYDKIPGPDGIVIKSKNNIKVVNEFGPDGPFVVSASRGGAYATDDALSTIGAPLVSPDDLESGQQKQLYIADGQAQTVFKLPHNGGIPIAFITLSTTGSDWFNPFGVEIAPPGFDGPNVDPDDLIVADNGFGYPSKHTVWAVNQQSGATKIIAQGTGFEGGPLRAEFGPDGTLYVFENIGPSGTSRIVTVAADGTVSPYVEYIPGRPALAVHPKNGDVYFVYVTGELFRLTDESGTPELFASNLGSYQSIEFSHSGLSLFVSASERDQVIEIRGNRQAWGLSKDKKCKKGKDKECKK
jgi:hypothetical protein